MQIDLTRSASTASFGQFLFRNRAKIAVPFFIILLIFSRPSSYYYWGFALALWAAGMTLRVWASGYIGRESRGSKFSTQHRIVNGPYRIFKHPIYLGNFLLVAGTVLLYNPPLYIGLPLIVLFLIQYGVIINAEKIYLQRLKRKIARFHFSKVKGEISTVIVLGFIFAIYLFKNTEIVQP